MQQVRQAPNSKGCHGVIFIKRFPRNEEFRRRLLGGCSAASIAVQKLRNVVEKYKQWWMNDPSTGQRSANGEKRKRSTQLLPGETFRGRLTLSLPGDFAPGIPSRGGGGGGGVLGPS